MKMVTPQNANDNPVKSQKNVQKISFKLSKT